MRIWLDDIREMPDGFDVWCKDTFHALRLIVDRKVSYISFDHDLGCKNGQTGYDLASAIEELAYYKIVAPIAWDIHSANPVGRKNIEMAMRSAERYWKQ